MSYADFLAGAYQEQLGRAPDAEGQAHWLNALETGAMTQQQVLNAINQSLEGQNYDTQVITSEYRSNFGRDPEQEGYQYWMSVAQNNPAVSGSAMDEIIARAAQGADIAAMQAMPAGYTDFTTAALQADPWANRRATESIYGVAPDVVNISGIGQVPVNFVTPVTMQPIISTYDPATGQFTTTAGADILSPDRVLEAVSIARGSGALSQAGAEQIMDDLTKAQNMGDVYAALSRPQAGVVVDQIYGMQLGEDVDANKARQEAIDRQKVLDTFDYAPAYDYFGQSLEAAGITNPFAPGNYQAGTLARQANVVTPQNFQQLVNQTLQQLYGFTNYLPTPAQTSFYSERGFEPEFTPFGEAPTFRSGVAGYTENLPQGFRFTPELVSAPTNVFTPGEFKNTDEFGVTGIMGRFTGALPGMGSMTNPVTGTTTSGNIIGYSERGTPIYGVQAADTTGGG